MNALLLKKSIVKTQFPLSGTAICAPSLKLHRLSQSQFRSKSSKSNHRFPASPCSPSTSSPSTNSRFKSTHHPTSTSKQNLRLVKEKPSEVKSASNPEDSTTESHIQPPPSHQSNAPRLIRYQDDSNQISNQVYIYPKSYIHSYHPSPRSYKAANESRRAPASLFSFHPSTSTSNSTLPVKSSLFIETDPDPSSSIKPTSGTQAAQSQSQSQLQSSSITDMSSSIANSASQAETQLKQRKDVKNGSQRHDHSHDGHSHGWLGSHSHSHDHGGSAEEADNLLAALKGKGESHRIERLFLDLESTLED